MYFPLSYDKLNLINGTYTPSCVKSFNNQVFEFWQRAFFQRALSAIDIEIPAAWEEATDFFLLVLFSRGYAGIFEKTEYGVTFQPGSVSGINWYYGPTKFVYTNPNDETDDNELTIGEDCEILKLTPDYRGIWDLINYYAEEMALLKNALNMSIINNKFAFVLGAKNKAAGEALKKMLDKINSGEPAVIFDQKLANDPVSKDEPFQHWDQGNLKERYLTTDQLADMRTVLQNFDQEVGIPTLRTEKKERMITDEVQSVKNDAISRATTWVRCINKSAKAVNKHFGLNISAKLHFEGGEDDGTSETNADDAVSV